jgi:hypothetical protein
MGRTGAAMAKERRAYRGQDIWQVGWGTGAQSAASRVLLTRPPATGSSPANAARIAAARPWFKGGGAGWLVIGVLVLAWDLTAPETLSEAFRRARSGRVSCPVVVVAWAMLTGHLFALLPRQADPIRAALDVVRQAMRCGKMLISRRPWHSGAFRRTGLTQAEHVGA